ncbi:Dyp-type peroxidase [Spongiibacter sp. KMU-166]|uniref:Dyp-type peroxidase n=1 Tax=Spongiibacter thalassae TaxID=2721624 RepID=A0ABX1GG33_9GAMM|nr:Dyp-type peroxidase [Spongiibacter thalassae]NKI18154.1 Dyp-type peroxidase [Spongiibacter thalassae]
MSNPQPGIFVEGSRSHFFLEYQLLDTVAPALLQQQVGAAIAALRQRDGRGVNIVWAFSADCWQRLDKPQPAGLKPFQPIGQGDKTAPASQRSIFVWVHGDSHSDNFDTALRVTGLLEGIARLELEVNGFVYKDSRDLTGFIDGTENPKEQGRQKVALIPDGEIGAGGSFVLSQQWQHQLKPFHALPEAEQEKVIGRTKADSIELDDEVMPEDSHVSRSDVKLDGVAQKLYRRSVPYGGVRDHGLYFLAFSCELERYDRILASMFGTTDDGVRDRITDFSTPLTGNYWFSPSRDELYSLVAD